MSTLSLASVGPHQTAPIPPSKKGTLIPVIPTLDSLAARTVNAKKIQGAVDKAYGIIAQGKQVKVDPDLFTRYVKTYAELVKQLHRDAEAINQGIKKGQKIAPEIRKAHQELENLLGQMSDKVSAVYRSVSAQMAAQPAVLDPMKPAAGVPSTKPASRPDAPKLKKGETPLHWAVRNHRHDLVLQLRMMGHSPIAPDSRGLTPLDEAVLQGDNKMVQILLFAELLSDPQKQAVFTSQFQNAQQKLGALAQVNLSELSPVCRAAFEGNTEELEVANGLDTPDADGLTPLHYALLGGNPKAVQYLASRCSSLHYLTKKGHSYLDYAMLSGNLAFYEAFQGFGLPFRLDSQDKQFVYLIASGLLYQQISRDAHRKDPIAVNGVDVSSGINNVLNLGFQGLGLMTQRLGADPAGGQADIDSWLPWFNQKTHNFATGANPIMAHFNDINGFQQLQQQKLLPRVAGIALQAFQACYLLYNLGHWASQKLNILDAETAKKYAWAGPSALIDSKFGAGTSDFIWKGFALYKVVGVTKAVLPKIGAYWDAFKSRPAAVLKRAALDAFNLGSQSFFAYQAFA